MTTQLQHTFHMTDCPNSLLGKLEAPQIGEGETVVNGVALPAHVIEELRMLGVPLSWYNNRELSHIVDACHYDRNLIDDPHGVHLYDKMHYSTHEAAADSHPHAHPRLNRTRNIHLHSFSEELEEERKKKEQAHWAVGA